MDLVGLDRAALIVNTARRAHVAVWGLLLSVSLAFGQEANERPATAGSSETKEAAEEKPTAPETEPEGMGLAAMAICRSIEDREPIGAAETFPSDVGHLFCFTAIQRAEPPTMVFHRWYVGERMINEIKIDVDGERWRCWSRKTILPRWKGECRVEVLTEEGDVLGTRKFTLE